MLQLCLCGGVLPIPPAIPHMHSGRGHGRALAVVRHGRLGWWALFDARFRGGFGVDGLEGTGCGRLNVLVLVAEALDQGRNRAPCR